MYFQEMVCTAHYLSHNRKLINICQISEWMNSDTLELSWRIQIKSLLSLAQSICWTLKTFLSSMGIISVPFYRIVFKNLLPANIFWILNECGKGIGILSHVELLLVLTVQTGLVIILGSRLYALCCVLYTVPGLCIYHLNPKSMPRERVSCEAGSPAEVRLT